MGNIIHGDCIEIMKTFPNNCIDHVICDLPYFKIVKNDWDNQWKTEKDYLDWIEKIIIEYDRILKENSNIFLFTSRQFNRKISNILDKFFTEKRIIIWARKRFGNQTFNNSLTSGYEPISFYSKGKGYFKMIKILSDKNRKIYTEGILKNGITLSDVWTDIPALPHNSPEKLNHPTQKPYALIERIIQIGTKENDTILDNCAGSGTVGEVCKNMNRNYILIENNKMYIDIIHKRLNYTTLF